MSVVRHRELFFLIAFVSGGMGMGDVKLAGFIGVVTGRFAWEVTVAAILAARRRLLRSLRYARKVAVSTETSGKRTGVSVSPGPCVVRLS